MGKVIISLFNRFFRNRVLLAWKVFALILILIASHSLLGDKGANNLKKIGKNINIYLWRNRRKMRH